MPTRLQAELWRKAIHVGSGGIPVAYAIFDSRGVMIWCLGIMSLGMCFIEWVRRTPSWLGRMFRGIFGGILREGEKRGGLLGSTAYGISSLLVILCFPQEVAVLALLFLALADTAASLVGLCFGRTRIGRKTLEGAVAFWLVASAVVVVMNSVDAAYPLLAGLMAAPLIALAELLIDWIDDNWTVPLLSGVVIWGLTFTF